MLGPFGRPCIRVHWGEGSVGNATCAHLAWCDYQFSFSSYIVVLPFRFGLLSGTSARALLDAFTFSSLLVMCIFSMQQLASNHVFIDDKYYTIW